MTAGLDLNYFLVIDTPWRDKKGPKYVPLSIGKINDIVNSSLSYSAT
jgi:hypothetical protein